MTEHALQNGLIVNQWIHVKFMFRCVSLIHQNGLRTCPHVTGCRSGIGLRRSKCMSVEVDDGVGDSAGTGSCVDEVADFLEMCRCGGGSRSLRG